MELRPIGAGADEHFDDACVENGLKAGIAIAKVGDRNAEAQRPATACGKPYDLRPDLYRLAGIFTRYSSR